MAHLGIKLIIVEGGKEKEVAANSISGLTIRGSGENNVIRIEPPFTFDNFSIEVNGNNNIVKIGGGAEIRTLKIAMTTPTDNRKVVIERNAFIVGGAFHLPVSGDTISVGCNCLFSDKILLSAQDGHPIWDDATGELINKGGSITVGSNVWLGYGATLCKNVALADNIIVGANSVVTKRFDKSYIAIAGSPAKIVKENVDFSRLLISSYIKNLSEGV